MNSINAKRSFVESVEEALQNGARLSAISTISEISERTIQRWRKEIRRDLRKGSKRSIPHRLSEAERKEIIATACSREFVDNYPSEIVAKLAEKGVYIASEATFYRVLKEERLLSHRRHSKAPVKREKPRLKATGPDQIYSWDITWLKTDVAGLYYYLYLVVDIFSRKIVHWEIHNSESSEKAADMLRKISAKKIIRGLTLHSDNGSPMKGYTMLAMMQALNITPSFSRPRVSTDNPFSESLFRTLKYRPFYPDRFSSIDKAQDWIKRFVYWYNHEHLHSGISYVTPHDRHYGKDVKVLEKRRVTYQEAYKKNPRRWSRGPKEWKRKEVVYINPVINENELKIAG
jgi:transposase InsO family protein